MKTETQITAELVKAGRQLGNNILNNHSNEFAAGFPDVYNSGSLYNGWIEFKGQKTPLRTNQKVIIRDLIKHGDNVCIVRFIRDEDEIFTAKYETPEGFTLYELNINFTEKPLQERRRITWIEILKICQATLG